MRMTGSSEPSAIFVRGGDVGIFQRGQELLHFLRVAFAAFAHHQNARSPTTATATMALTRIGHMTGPPLHEELEDNVCEHGIHSFFGLVNSVQLQFVSDAGLKKLVAGADRQMPVLFDKFHRRAVKKRKAG